MDSYGRGRRGCIDCNFGVVPPSSLSLTVRYDDVTFDVRDPRLQLDPYHGDGGAIAARNGCQGADVCSQLWSILHQPRKIPAAASPPGYLL
jgi:hypothetical protein